jgi:phosphate transport system protein
MERQFDQQIEKLKTRIMKMCSLVDEQVEMAIRLIEDEDPSLAEIILEKEKKVDKYDLKIDLRLIMSALTINTNLERMGDIAVNIVENSALLGKKPEWINKTHFSEMAKIAREMIRLSIDSFIQDDAKLAKKVIETDVVLDNYNKENHRILIDIMKENPENIQKAVALLVISRQIERLGDHATNIAEDVYFIVEARMVKHKYEKLLFAEDSDTDEE